MCREVEDIIFPESINNFDIERRIMSEKATQTEIHGFSDASERYFGEVVYCRINSSADETIVRLRPAKLEFRR
ncbi:hypothetical protein NPIL_529801 [Nephila pilipes]|uniref:Uncharacterized protein n=1 Tax=Nephila pilipes TaxID=299642 RepID=A0A8X6PWF9_NEPPI|nr:hypothetical protein NPIL_529801 [Nephila pilipes]